jgi:hypothetical protein
MKTPVSLSQMQSALAAERRRNVRLSQTNTALGQRFCNDHRADLLARIATLENNGTPQRPATISKRLGNRLRMKLLTIRLSITANGDLVTNEVEREVRDWERHARVHGLRVGGRSAAPPPERSATFERPRVNVAVVAGEVVRREE